MEFGVTSGGLAQLATGCLVLGVWAGRRIAPAAAALESALGPVLARGDLEGDLGATLLLQALPGVAAQRVLLVGLGAEDTFTEARYHSALRAAMHALQGTGAAEAAIALHALPVNGRAVPWKIEQAVLAAREGLYRFDKLKSHPPPARHRLRKLQFHLEGDSQFPAARAAIERAAAIAEGIALAKDLGNLPGNVCTPAYLADEARSLGERHGFSVQVLEQPQIEQHGMGGLLAVARGSRQPPRFIVMEYAGAAPDSPPVVLVGKGITFDTGGISIKPAPEMDEMKFDMCGAASVLGALHAVALLKLPLNVIGLVPATENMPDGNAVKPGDIVTTLSGRTVEIIDTDSEGRVVLCDALSYADRYRPAAVIDIATLTGAIVSALGDVATGLFANDDALARELVQAGDSAWDRAWHMPLWDDYQDALKSNFADLQNVGVRGDNAVTAACFLSRFARRYPWAHLDIAGTAAKGGADKGATGRPVALLVHFLLARAAAL